LRGTRTEAIIKKKTGGGVGKLGKQYHQMGGKKKKTEKFSCRSLYTGKTMKQEKEKIKPASRVEKREGGQVGRKRGGKPKSPESD